MRFSLGEKMGLRGEYILSLLLLFNSFYWYFIAQNITSEIALEHANNYFIEMFFPISIIISSLVSSFIFSKVRKIRFLKLWVFIGTAASLLPLLPFRGSLIDVVVVITLGISFGMGMPSLLSYLVESVPVEHRGKIGGFTFFMVTICAPIFILFGTFNSALNTLLLPSWRSWGLLALLIFSRRNSLSVNLRQSDQRKISLQSLFTNRTFTYYLVAWLLFSLVDGVASSLWVLNPNETRARAMIMIEAPVAGLSALVGGAFADRWGRKKIIIFGFVSLGAAYALIPMTSLLVGGIPEFLWPIFFATNGLAIGSLWSIFTIVIWGEISRYSVEKHYAVGEVPYFLTQLVYLTLTPYITHIYSMKELVFANLMKDTFSFAAFFLFIAVIPLLFVDETLPKRKIEERQLRTYTEEAIKLKQKVIQK